MFRRRHDPWLIVGPDPDGGLMILGRPAARATVWALAAMARDVGKGARPMRTSDYEYINNRTKGVTF
jgi:hypothetical protein